MFIVKGVNIFPIQVERVLMSIPEVGNNYVIVLKRRGPMDEMIVQIEVQSSILQDGIRHLEHLQDRIARALRDEILITPKVELVEPGSLPSTEGKAVRVIDHRTMYGG